MRVVLTRRHKYYRRASERFAARTCRVGTRSAMHVSVMQRERPIYTDNSLSVNCVNEKGKAKSDPSQFSELIEI